MPAQSHSSPVQRPPLSRRMQAVQDPIIPLLGEWIRAQPGTISLGQGVVYYPPPAAALAAARAYPETAEAHRYGPVAGEAALREAIQVKLANDNAIAVSDERIVVTAGSNMGFVNSLLAIADPGDEIILLTPYYFNHEMAISMLGCVCVPVATDANYQPDLAAISAAITPRSRAVVTVSPNNPTGAVYPRATLKAINDLCREQGLYHISDEAYEYFTYDGHEHFSPASDPAVADHTISLFSLSKTYGLAGWRIGYMVIPPAIATAVQKAQDTNLICPTLVAQQAAVAALDCGGDYCRQHLGNLAATRHQILAALQPLAGRCAAPAADGAFYILLRVATDMDSLTLTQRLIAEHQVAVLPGQTFGCSDGCYLRISYGALAGPTAVAGTDRLVSGLATLLDD